MKYQVKKSDGQIIVETNKYNEAVKKTIIFLIENQLKTIEEIKTYQNSLLLTVSELEEKINTSSMDKQRKESAIKMLQQKKKIDGSIKNGDLRYDPIDNDLWVRSGLGIKAIEQNFFQKLQNENLIQYFFDVNESDLLTEEEEEINGNSQMKTQPLNQILYGPPGTGKTYNTITKALEIIDNDFYQKNQVNRETLKVKFEEYRKSGQIEFVTFHQSYGYEEFVEGIKPCDLNSCENTDHKEIKYSVQRGIFKKLCEEADKSSFEQSYELYIQNELNDQEVTLQTKTSVVFKISKSEYGIQTDKSNSFAKDRLIEIYNGVRKSNPDTTYGQFIVEDIIKKYPLRNYILIIDEINRGNISKIFGELITLIEPSKRIGADEAIKLKLPYSNKEFSVPQNLYIIGTMNTADRSIAQIDTALRRRFVFEEMLPKPELLIDINNQPLVIEEDDKKIEIQKILQAINERIEYIYDREHQIGHSYFMPLQKDNSKVKLDEIFRVNIIPLLAEYFYGDWHDIKIVLNDDDGYFISEENELGFALMNTKRKKNLIFRVNSSFSVDGYVNIYKTK